MNDQQREQKRIDDAAAKRERRKWLVSLTDLQAVGLDARDRYDRIRYLGEIEAAEFVRQARISMSEKAGNGWQKD